MLDVLRRTSSMTSSFGRATMEEEVSVKFYTVGNPLISAFYCFTVLGIHTFTSLIWLDINVLSHKTLCMYVSSLDLTFNLTSTFKPKSVLTCFYKSILHPLVMGLG